MRLQVWCAIALFAVSAIPPGRVLAASAPQNPLQVGNAHISPTVGLAAQMGIGRTGLGLKPGSSANLINANNGPVMDSTNIYAIFWLPANTHFESDGLASSDTSYQNGITGFFGALGGTYNSSLWKLASQYQGSNGSISQNGLKFAGSWVDTTAYPTARPGTAANPLSDGDIQEAVKRALANNRGWSSGVESAYMVYTAFDARACLADGTCDNVAQPKKGMCAYHSYFNQNGAPVIYAHIPSNRFDAAGNCTFFVQSPNNDLGLDLTLNSSSHELFEMATDPTLNAWYDQKGNEIGDLCNQSFGATDNTGANVLLGPQATPYIVQSEWSNLSNSCELQLPPTVTSVTPLTGFVPGNYPATITGTGLRTVLVPGQEKFLFGSNAATNIVCKAQLDWSDSCTLTVPAASDTVDVTMVNVTETAILGLPSSIPSVQFTYRPACQSIALASNTPSPQPAGTSIRLVSTAPVPDLCYLQYFQFSYTTPDGTQTVPISAGPNGLADWATSSLQPGTYLLSIAGYPDPHGVGPHVGATMAFTLTDAVPQGGGGGSAGGPPGGVPVKCHPVCRLE
jgi:hypothetical protein